MGGGPVRTCAGCRSRKPQTDLIRVARRPGGTVGVDVGVRSPGRGAYVCPQVPCIDLALRSGRLRRTLRLEGALPEEVKDRLVEAISSSSNRG